MAFAWAPQQNLLSTIVSGLGTSGQGGLAARFAVLKPGARLPKLTITVASCRTELVCRLTHEEKETIHKKYVVSFKDQSFDQGLM